VVDQVIVDVVLRAGFIGLAVTITTGAGEVTTTVALFVSLPTALVQVSEYVYDGNVNAPVVHPPLTEFPFAVHPAEPPAAVQVIGAVPVVLHVIVDGAPHETGEIALMIIAGATGANNVGPTTLLISIHPKSSLHAQPPNAPFKMLIVVLPLAALEKDIHPAPGPYVSARAQPVTAPVPIFAFALHGAEGHPPKSAGLKLIHPMLSLHAYPEKSPVPISIFTP
jgi:hypothetical protein